VLLPEGVTYARVRADPAGFEEARHFRYPGGALTGSAPVVTREMPIEISVIG